MRQFNGDGNGDVRVNHAYGRHTVTWPRIFKPNTLSAVLFVLRRVLDISDWGASNVQLSYL